MMHDECLVIMLELAQHKTRFYTVPWSEGMEQFQMPGSLMMATLMAHGLLERVFAMGLRPTFRGHLRERAVLPNAPVAVKTMLLLGMLEDPAP